MKNYDIAIVGGGMVGAALALSLSDTSLRIVIIDQHSLKPGLIAENAPYSPRVSALTEASVQLFKRLGVWDTMRFQRVCPYRHMRVWDGEGTGEITFDAGSVGYPQLGYIVENPVIRASLLKGLEDTSVDLLEASGELSFRPLEAGYEVVPEKGQAFHCQLLVGADGAESAVRKWAGIPQSQKDCLHHAIVTTVEIEKHHQDTAWQIFLDTGPLAFLPVPDQDGKHYCSIVWSLLPERADAVIALDEDAFCKALGRAFEQRLGTVIRTDKRYRFPLKHRHARHYYRQGIVLVGDACHTIHPLAGQGVNLGLQDVEALSRELIRACERDDDIAGKHILGRYQRHRKGANMTMLAAMDGFQHLFHADDLAIRWLRNTGLNLANDSHLIKECIVKQAMGISETLVGKE
ncbi:FAD-dependent monooxygenase [Endozoicomonas euniceicola]|uniref:FAD-dependent monooxygenase n=1 Tax=Endozoicomonas euniceicola TaxID=1234143 RepID=A0ABY6GMP5_9GAMM|nr:FAD-dependent monooxygenase [Endozoicomonas euniceicola]UYM13971.1 FAD-dependent monooxygenase [Endozoicomonas euniceicola]